MSGAAFYDFFRRIRLTSEDGLTLKANLEADSTTDELTIQESPGVALTATGDALNDAFKIDVDYDLFSPLGTTAIRLQDVNSNNKDITFTAGSNMIISRIADDEIKFISTSTGDTAEIQNITQTDPVVITTREIHGFARHISVIPVEIQGMTELNGNQYFIDIISDTQIALYTDPNLTTSVDGTGFTAYTGNGLIIADRVLDSLDQLKDTDIQNPFTDQVLKYNGSSWTPELIDPDSLGGNRVFVSAEKGNDANDGVMYPVATIKRACEIASGMVYDSGGNFVRNISIMVATGDYVEQNPIIVPDNVSIIGDNLRKVLIRPANAKQDIFRVRNGCYINGVTFRDAVDGAGVPVDTFRYAVSFDDVLDTSVSRVAYTNLPSTRPKIFLSPYMQNCSVISFLGGNGVEIDGNLIDTPNTPLNNIEAENPVNLADGIPEQGKSMVANALTILSFGGNAWRVINDAYAQIVSCFVIFTENGCLTQNGGYLSITNSASNFGLFALRSTGYSPNSFEFDRGWISSNGINAGFQTLTAVGLKRSAIEHFVIRIRNSIGSDITDNFNSNSTLGIEQNIIPTGSNVSSNTITFPVAHNFQNGDIVEYDANQNVEIFGLLDETTYYVSVVDPNTISLYHDEEQTKAVRDLDGSTATGSHSFRRGYEDFFINEIIESHNVYQDLILPTGAYTPNIGDRISGLNGASVVSADISAWDSGTRTLTVSINKVQEGDNQVRNLFATNATIDAGQIATGAVTILSTTQRSDLYTSEFTLLSTVGGRVMQNIANAKQNQIYLHRPSICNSSAHTWEYSGSGTDYNALPQNGGQTNEFFEQVSTKPGRVYTSGTNEIGDFKVGDFVRAFNRTGNIDFKNKVTIGELDSLSLSLSSGVVVNEISTDIELGDNEVDGAKHTRLVTQLAARSFLDNRLGNFIDKQLSTNAIPSAVVQLNSSGQINTDLIPPQGNFNSYTVDSFEGRLGLQDDIPAVDLRPGDIVIEEYQELVLTLTGSVTVSKGETITQANTLATGIVKEAVTGNIIKLVQPITGTFNTSDVLSGSTSGVLGANSVPTNVSNLNTITDNYFLKTSKQSQFLLLDKTQSYDFTNIILNQTPIQGAVSGAVATVDTQVNGVLSSVNFLNLPNGNGYTSTGTYTNIPIVAVTGTGTGALANVTIAGGQVTGFDIVRGGNSYSDGDTVTINDSDVGGRSGGTQFEINVTDIENRLYVILDQNAGLEFNANPINLDFIIDDNVTSFEITDQASTAQLSFNAEDIGSSGDVDAINNRIVFDSAHGYSNGDPVEYDSNSNVSLGGLTNGDFYYIKVIDSTTVELYNDYSLSASSQVIITATGTGVHLFRLYNVSVEEDRFYFQSHGLLTGDAVRVDSSDPAAPINDEDYLFVGGVTANSFTLHSARGAALDSVNGLIVSAVDVTSTGTGSVIIEKQNVTIIGDVNTSGNDQDNWSSLSTSAVDAQNIATGIIDPARLGSNSANDKTFLRGDSQYSFAVQGITNKTANDPITLTGLNYNDGTDDVYYDIVDLRVELAGYENPVNPSAGTERVGVAAFDFDHFEIDITGKVTTKSSNDGGVIDADTLDGQEGSYYEEPINLSRAVPISRGGTNITSMTAGDILYADTNIGSALENENFDDTMSTLAVGSNNDVLVVASGLPAWSNTLTLESVTVNNIQVAVTGDNEIDTVSGNLTIDSAGGTVTVDDNLSVNGTLGTTGQATLNTAIIENLTDNRIVLAGVSKNLEDNANLTFNGTTFAVGVVNFTVSAVNGNLTSQGNGSFGGTLEVEGQTTLASAAVTNLSNNAIVYSGTDGELLDSSNLTFDGSILNATATISVTGQMSVNDLNLNSNTINTLSEDLVLDSFTGETIINDNLTISGNLLVSGTTTTVNTETINLADNIVVLNSNETGAPSQNSGIEIERGTEANKTLVWDEAVDKWSIGSEIFVAGTVEADVTGDITGNLTGQVSDISNHNTGDLEEGSNLYFTTARARSALSEGGDISYDSNTGVISVTTYKTADFNSDFQSKSTDDLSEGTTNLYFTTGRIDAHLTGGTGVDYTTGTISIGQAVGTTDTVTFNTVTATNGFSGNIQGSVSTANSTTIINFTNNSVNLNGTVKDHIITDSNEVYDLGSETNRFRDLYLGNTINLGGVEISSDGNELTLPQTVISGGGTVLDSTNSNTDNLSEGDANLYYTDARVETVVTKNYVDGLNVDADTLDGLNSSEFLRTNITTDDLTEGTTNLFYTDAKVESVVTKTYVDGLNVDAGTLDGLSSGSFLRTTGNIIYNSNTNTDQFFITRSGSQQNEYTRIGRDNTTTHFYTRNDDLLTSVKFTFDNTDTLTGTGTNANISHIQFTGDTDGARIELSGGSDIAFPEVYTIAVDNTFGLWTDAPELRIGGSAGNRVLTTADEGIDNGLDADTVDGIQAASFVRSDVDDTKTGNLFLSNAQIYGGFGAETTAGSTNWNDSIVARSGNGYTLLQGFDTNGPDNTSNYYHPFSFEYSSKDGSGNLTQFAIPYINGRVHYRTRYQNGWSAWREILDSGSGNFNIAGDFLPDTNNTRDIGASNNKFNTVHATLFNGTALEAYYADLAENYVADTDYEPGTVLIFGGDQEVTITDQFQDNTVAGVVSTNPAYLMNSQQEGDHVIAVALQGRVPCKVKGPIKKGQMLVTSSVPGCAEAACNPGVGTVIGKSLESKSTDDIKFIEIVVGKN